MSTSANTSDFLPPFGGPSSVSGAFEFIPSVPRGGTEGSEASTDSTRVRAALSGKGIISVTTEARRVYPAIPKGGDDTVFAMLMRLETCSRLENDPRWACPCRLVRVCSSYRKLASSACSESVATPGVRSKNELARTEHGTKGTQSRPCTLRCPRPCRDHWEKSNAHLAARKEKDLDPSRSLTTSSVRHYR